MKISKPFSDLPIWEFYEVDIPDLDYEKFDFKTLRELNKENPCLQDEIYEKRRKSSPIGNSSYDKLIQNVHSIIHTISESEDNSNVIMVDNSLLFSMGPWYFEKNEAEIVIDNKGYNIGYHLDNRNIKANLFLNLEDNESSTDFFIIDPINTMNYDSYTPSKKEWSGPTKKGSGYFYFNNHTFWHKINVTEEERKILMMGIYIN